MAEEWVIVKDPMAGDYETPHETRQETPRSADLGAVWTLDVGLLMERLWALYAETKKIDLQADWLWTRVVGSFWDSCGDLDKLGVLKF
jgi:hypothetical protein